MAERPPRTLGQAVAGLDLPTAGAFGGLIVIIVGSLAPWVTSPLGSLSGISGDGKWTALLALIGAALLMRGMGGTAIAATLIAATGIYDAIHLQHAAARITVDGVQVADVGWGVYVVIAGSVGALLALLVGARQMPVRHAGHVAHGFTLTEPDDVAQERLRDELGPQIIRMGFKADHHEPGVLTYRTRFMLTAKETAVVWWLTPFTLIILPLATLQWAWRWLTRQRIEVTFEPEADGTRVQVDAQVSRGVGRMLALLGTPGHWPDAEDPDWIATPSDDLSWVDEVDMATADRMTRRAVKRAQRNRA